MKRKLRPGDRVIFIMNGLIHKGTLERIYEFNSLMIIKLENGALEKVSAEFVALDTLTETEPPLAKEEPRLINKADFVKTLYKVASPDGMLGERFGEVDPEAFLDNSITVLLVGLDLVEAVFKANAETKIERCGLIGEIVQCTTPKALSKHIGSGDTESVSKFCRLVFNKLVKEFFEATND